MALPANLRPLYTPAQLREVYDRLQLPSRYRYEPGEFSKEVVRHRDGHNFLNALVTHTLANVPFENLELHYSTHHQVSIHPDALFDKIVRQGRGRGGYCMELNVFLGTVLRSLGFEVMSVGARVNGRSKPEDPADNDEPVFGGWSHMVNLVTIRGDTYMVDVGFGSRGPVRPVPLTDGTIVTNMAPDGNVRLRHSNIPQSENLAARLWILDGRGAVGDPWVPLYCFEAIVCFLPQDLEVMNFFTSVHRTSVFTYRIICCRFVLDESQEHVIGEVVLKGDELHERIRGEKRRLATLRSEKERIEALEQHFGVTLNPAQQAGIRGMSTCLAFEYA